MSLDKNWLRSRIRGVLQKHEVFSPEAVELLMLTAAQESLLGTYLTQVNGPALSIFQVEPATYSDIYHRVLKKRWPGRFSIDPLSMITDFDVSIMACRGKYLSIPKPIPRSLEGLAQYWKTFYNTALGSGKTSDAVKNYKKYC